MVLSPLPSLCSPPRSTFTPSCAPLCSPTAPPLPETTPYPDDYETTLEEAYTRTCSAIAFFQKLGRSIRDVDSHEELDGIALSSDVYWSVRNSSAMLDQHIGTMEGQLATLSAQTQSLGVLMEQIRNDITEADRRYEAQAIPLYAAVAAFHASGPHTVRLPDPLPLSMLIPWTAAMDVATNGSGEITIDTTVPLTLAEHSDDLAFVEQRANRLRKLLNVQRSQMAFIRRCTTTVQNTLEQSRKQLRAYAELEVALEECFNSVAVMRARIMRARISMWEEMDALAAEENGKEGSGTVVTVRG